MKKRSVILLSLLTLAPFLWTGCSGGQAKGPGNSARQIVGVHVAQVRKQEIDRRVETVGTLVADQEVTISSETEGRVTEVLADLGDRVQKGKPLVTILPDEMRYSLAQQEAQLRQALGRLGLKNENDRVADINQVPDVMKAAADLREAEQRFKRVKDLVAENVASAQDLDQAQARYNALGATLEVTRLQVQNLVSLVDQYRASVSLARKKLRDTSVLAPFDGSIRDRQVQVGQYVKPQTPLYELVNTDQLRLRAEVPEKMSSWVRLGNTVEIQVEAHPGRIFKGRVSRMSPAVDQQKRTFVIEALIPNAEGVLRPGFYSRAAIVTDKKDSVLLIPASAILYAYGTNKAFVIDGGKASARELKLGERVGDDVEVVEGLRAEERVAIGDLDRLDNGAPVQILDR